MQKIMPLVQFTINLEWCASEAHTRGELLLRGHGANRVNTMVEMKFVYIQYNHEFSLEMLRFLWTF